MLYVVCCVFVSPIRSTGANMFVRFASDERCCVFVVLCCVVVLCCLAYLDACMFLMSMSDG